VPAAVAIFVGGVTGEGWPVRWKPVGGTWQGEGVSETTSADARPAQWLTLPDVAERLDLPINRVHQLVRERALLAVRRDGVLRVPAELLANRTVLKHLPGVLTLLHDAGYNDEEALRWLYSPDETLRGGTPARALGGDGATEVKRRAQALGF
jgi:hypothetical protein